MDLGASGEISYPNRATAAYRGRTFGSDGATAAPLVNAAVQSLQEREVSAVLLTFPGEGAVTDGKKCQNHLKR